MSGETYSNSIGNREGWEKMVKTKHNPAQPKLVLLWGLLFLELESPQLTLSSVE